MLEFRLICPKKCHTANAVWQNASPTGSFERVPAERQRADQISRQSCSCREEIRGVIRDAFVMEIRGKPRKLRLEAAMKSFFAGLGFGAVVGLLVAPKRGKETRAGVGRRAQRFIRAATDMIAGRPRDRQLPIFSKKSPASAPISRTMTETDSAAEVLNAATRDQLIAVHGIGEVLADRIIENRPYESAYEVVERGILSERTFVLLRRELLDKGA